MPIFKNSTFAYEKYLYTPAFLTCQISYLPPFVAASSPVNVSVLLYNKLPLENLPIILAGVGLLLFHGSSSPFCKFRGFQKMTGCLRPRLQDFPRLQPHTHCRPGQALHQSRTGVPVSVNAPHPGAQRALPALAGRGQMLCKGHRVCDPTPATGTLQGPRQTL